MTARREYKRETYRMKQQAKQQESSTNRFLFGKKVAGLSAPVQSIIKYGDQRIIRDQRNNTMTVTKGRLRAIVSQVLIEEERKKAVASVRPMLDGRATVKIGGQVKGTTQIHKTMLAARQAAFDRYKYVK